MFKVYFILIIVQILFGINFPASKVIVTKMDPILWSNIRFLAAGFLMLIVTLLSRRKHPPLSKEFFSGLVPLSILGMALGQGLFLVGLKHTTSINSAILITCIPILTLVIVILRKQEKLTFNKFSGFVLAFLGVILIRDITSLRIGNDTLIGDFLVFAGAFCFALYLSYGKKFFMSFDNMWSTTWMFFISGFAMIFINLNKFSDLNNIEYDSTLIYCALFSIIGATLLTYLLNNWALRRASSGSVAIFIYLQPIVAGIIGYFFLQEEVTLRLFICSIFIMGGLLFSVYDNVKLQKSLKGKTNG
jgi:drug/metabolite transporter (DMT)-like permease